MEETVGLREEGKKEEKGGDDRPKWRKDRKEEKRKRQ